MCSTIGAERRLGLRQTVVVRRQADGHNTRPTGLQSRPPWQLVANSNHGPVAGHRRSGVSASHRLCSGDLGRFRDRLFDTDRPESEHLVSLLSEQGRAFAGQTASTTAVAGAGHWHRQRGQPIACCTCRGTTVPDSLLHAEAGSRMRVPPRCGSAANAGQGAWGHRSDPARYGDLSGRDALSLL